MNQYLTATKLLDFHHLTIQSLVEERGWRMLEVYQKIEHIYNYVKDEIQFGYNVDDAISASKILRDGYGQCNTKTILIMALLRAVGIPSRFHGFTLNKQVQSGVLGVLYHISPKEIVHTWAEVQYKGQWHPLEGLILDHMYLENIQKKFKDCSGSFCGWGVGTQDLHNPETRWQGQATYIQKEGIIDDLGIYDAPDDFYVSHQQGLNLLKKFLYRYVARHYMNRNVNKVRRGTNNPQ